MRHRRSGGSAALVVGLLLLAGCSVSPAEKSAGEPGIGVTAQKDSVPFENASISLEELVPTPAPATISIAGIVSDMPVEAHGLDDRGRMSLPRSPFVAGWYEYASAPADDAGATVIASHVDALGEGLGPFSRLRTVAAGTEVSIVDDAGGRHIYRVTAVERISKEVVPWEEYFSTTGAPRLVLVTCGGEYDASVGSYEDNYIVTAEKVS